MIDGKLFENNNMNRPERHMASDRPNKGDVQPKNSRFAASIENKKYDSSERPQRGNVQPVNNRFLEKVKAEQNRFSDIYKKDLTNEIDTQNKAEQESKISEINISSEKEAYLNEREIKGGSYRDVVKESDGDKYEVHHMPADSVSTLERNDGPAIKMEKQDHRQTASCGNSKEAREYRATQKELIDCGKFLEAIQMDIDDIHEKFGNKYDDAITEMLNYVDKLEMEENLNG